MWVEPYNLKCSIIALKKFCLASFSEKRYYFLSGGTLLCRFIMSKPAVSKVFFCIGRFQINSLNERKLKRFSVILLNENDFIVSTSVKFNLFQCSVIKNVLKRGRFLLNSIIKFFQLKNNIGIFALFCKKVKHQMSKNNVINCQLFKLMIRTDQCFRHIQSVCSCDIYS